ncbi:acyltransferase [Waterburya agarophytonicola K14]|uniref:Acyltransferase n=1 Tax=Waterburya agarophytonicola KI4 TaxID=2874699 RepID=A0A964BSF8_9CYAN|nr:acyltransferase [Waterburya agarophytonicola]MCC0177421.1 acyltransferase [Waterburya agarophytonicola KI4]
MMNSRNSREATDYLKGLAIFFVYVGHFLNVFAQLRTGYGNGFVSIFFLLSGYGIYKSLQRHDNPTHNIRNFVLNFFQKRLTRLYPLLWLKFILLGLPTSILAFFALDFINPQSPWFIPAIIQCYLVAPLLFLYFRKLNIKKSVLIIVTTFILLNVALLSLGVNPVKTLAYRGLFFQNIFLFLLGFILAKIDSFKALPKYALLLSFLIYLFCINETSPLSVLSFSGKSILFSLLFSCSTFLVCYAFLSRRINLPLSNFFQTSGKYSYSIYLFHGLSLTVLSAIGILNKSSEALLTNSIIALFWFPILLGFCSLLEIIIGEFIFGKRDIKNVKTKTLETMDSLKNPF